MLSMNCCCCLTKTMEFVAKLSRVCSISASPTFQVAERSLYWDRLYFADAAQNYTLQPKSNQCITLGLWFVTTRRHPSFSLRSATAVHVCQSHLFWCQCLRNDRHCTRQPHMLYICYPRVCQICFCVHCCHFLHHCYPAQNVANCLELNSISIVLSHSAKTSAILCTRCKWSLIAKCPWHNALECVFALGLYHSSMDYTNQ
mmetsp:Transcript_17982/g.28434  ORF Transcript_17982/g.28434 Transcript_17982/m.28434 type:complete len:201 (+) Transcript_17982:174-776(+)